MSNTIYDKNFLRFTSFCGPEELLEKAGDRRCLQVDSSMSVLDLQETKELVVILQQWIDDKI